MPLILLILSMYCRLLQLFQPYLILRIHQRGSSVGHCDYQHDQLNFKSSNECANIDECSVTKLCTCIYENTNHHAFLKLRMNGTSFELHESSLTC